MCIRDRNYYRTGSNSSRIPCQILSDVTGAIVLLRTPVRILHGGELLKSIQFLTLIRNISNRIIAVTERYGGWVDREEVERILLLAMDIKTVEENLRMEHLERYSNRLQRKMDFSGLIGKLEFEGRLTPFVPWLYAAQFLHIGRNTTCLLYTSRCV